MNYPKEFYVTTPIVGDKVWLDVDKFPSGKKAFHGPWWIRSIHEIGGKHGVVLRRDNGIESFVLVSQLLRMPRSLIKKSAVIKQ